MAVSLFPTPLSPTIKMPSPYTSTNTPCLVTRGASCTFKKEINAASNTHVISSELNNGTSYFLAMVINSSTGCKLQAKYHCRRLLGKQCFQHFNTFFLIAFFLQISGSALPIIRNSIFLKVGKKPCNSNQDDLHPENIPIIHPDWKAYKWFPKKALS